LIGTTLTLLVGPRIILIHDGGMISGLLFLLEDLLNSAHSTVSQANLDASWVVVSSEKLSDGSLDFATCSLICFEDYGDESAWLEGVVLSHRHSDVRGLLRKVRKLKATAISVSSTREAATGDSDDVAVPLVAEVPPRSPHHVEDLSCSGESIFMQWYRVNIMLE
jgi:hypothetical protein